jgi:hypothetical protein
MHTSVFLIGLHRREQQCCHLPRLFLQHNHIFLVALVCNVMTGLLQNL